MEDGFSDGLSGLTLLLLAKGLPVLFAVAPIRHAAAANPVPVCVRWPLRLYPTANDCPTTNGSNWDRRGMYGRGDRTSRYEKAIRRIRVKLERRKQAQGAGVPTSVRAALRELPDDRIAAKALSRRCRRVDPVRHVQQQVGGQPFESRLVGSS